MITIQHRNNFGILRVIFALMVFLSHIAALSQIHKIQWMVTFFSGTFAVQGFFFISGYLVFRSYERTDSILIYFKKRICRIAPAYVFVVTIIPVLLFFTSKLSFSDYFPSLIFWNYIKYNLLLSNFVAPTLPGVFDENPIHAVNGSLWTIKIEVMFYLIVPVLILISKRIGIIKTLIIAAILSIVWKVAFIAAGNFYKFPYFLKLSKQMPGQLSFFVAGAFGYYCNEFLKKNITLLSFSISLILYIISDGFLLHEVIAPFAIGIICFYLSIVAPAYFSKICSIDISYGLYLFHFPIIQTFICYGVEKKSLLVYLLFSFLASVFCAIISWYYIEKPFLNR